MKQIRDYKTNGNRKRALLLTRIFDSKMIIASTNRRGTLSLMRVNVAINIVRSLSAVG